nr:signal peptidase I [Acholeplasmatales bacterium]
MKKTIKGIITVILLLIVSILTYFVVANVVATKNNTISSFFGYSISYVPTESMEPTISKGSTIMFKKGDIKDANAGDIIVYKNTEHNIYVIHRIYQEVEDNKFIMKGDNNLTY